MDGVFVKRAGATVMNITGVVSGCLLAAMLLLLFSAGAVTGVGDILACLLLFLFGVLVTALFLLSLLFNRGAYLHLSEDGITGRFAWNTTLVCSYRDVVSCEVGYGSLNICLVDGGSYSVSGLRNAREICTEIRKRMPDPTGGETARRP